MFSGRIISCLIFVASFIYYVKKQSRRKKIESKSEDKISKTETVSDAGKDTEFLKEEGKSVADATVDDGYDGDTSNMSVCENETVEISTNHGKSKLEVTSDPSQSCVDPSQAELDDTMTAVAKLLALAEEQEAEFKKVESEVELLKAMPSPSPSLDKSEPSIDSSATKTQSGRSSSKTPIHPRVQLLKEGSFSFRSPKENLKPSPPNAQKSSIEPTSPRNAKLPAAAKVDSGRRPLFTIGASPITNSIHAKPSPPFYTRVAGTASKSLPAKPKTTSGRVAKPHKSLKQKPSSGATSKNEIKRFKPLHYKGAPQAKSVGLKVKLPLGQDKEESHNTSFNEDTLVRQQPRPSIQKSAK